ncbi:MAG: PD-(D/E)XK nuclease family protein [Selenomonadaceae bacterium]|nr:PD-(D/E)XK nuclease family protein [Selenomonadaceae bacterium]
MIERELTSLMYELLSPRENPERGRLYLELFDKHVLRLEMSAAELDSAKVYGEYPTQFIGRTRYIDLAIITSRRFIPIEVKIEADDQPSQCYDYWREAKLYTDKYFLSEPPVLYYLTPEGYSPSMESAKDFSYVGDLNLIRLDKIDNVAFRSELIHWLDACLKQTPENFSCRRKLTLLHDEIIEIVNRLCRTEPQLESLMFKFFSTLDARFTENFCKEYHLKRGSTLRGEVGDYHTYRRYVDRFFGKEFAEAAIALLCTNSNGNIMKLAKDKYLCFYLGGYNGVANDLGCSTALSASFLIFDRDENECVYRTADIKRLLGGKNILPQEFIKEYLQKGQKLAGMIGRIDLHDAHGNTIDFKNVDKTLRQFRTQEDISRAVDNIMTEIEKLLRRFVYG